jgi:hypothetical protein
VYRKNGSLAEYLRLAVSICISRVDQLPDVSTDDDEHDDDDDTMGNMRAIIRSRSRQKFAMVYYGALILFLTKFSHALSIASVNSIG